MSYSNNDVARLKEENEKLMREIKEVNLKNDELKREIALQEFRIPLNELTIGKLIGSGGFGEVYEGDWHGQAVAIKKLKANHIGQELIDIFVKEARTHMRLRHKHVVLLIGIAREQEHEDRDLMIVMEFMKHGSLGYLLFEQKMQLQRHQILQIALDIAKGLNYLHSLNPKIIHRDLKCENILLYRNKSRAKVSDFGTARQLNRYSQANSTAKHGTIFYMAPEMLGQKPYDEKVDVYAFGIVLFAMVRNEILPILEEQERLSRIDEGVTADINLRQLIRDCCRTDPKRRPTIRDCLNRLKEMRKKGKAEDNVLLTVDIPYEELVFDCTIGVGAYAIILEAEWRGMKVAAKQITKPFNESYCYEADILKKLRHKHIVTLFGCTMTPDVGDTILVLEYMKDGSLGQLLHVQQGILSHSQVIRIALDIAKGLDYLHSLTPKIIHRDIKSTNILLYNNWSRAKICDFGVAAPLAPSEYIDTKVGALGYVAPEIIQEKGYNEKVDVFSFGVVLLEMATKHTLGFMAEGELKSRIEEALNKSPTLSDVLPFKKLVHECCQFNPQARPSMKQCVEVLRSLRRQYF